MILQFAYNLQQIKMQELAQLQQILLVQQIAAELAHRDIRDIQIAQTLIKICKTARDQEQFIELANKNHINISKNFLDSLYNTIKQKLPQTHQLQFRPNKKHSAVKEEPHSHQLNYKSQKLEEEKEQQVQKVSSFPGLAIPDGDQIDLDLGLDQIPVNKKSSKVKQQQSSLFKKQQSIKVSASKLKGASPHKQKDRYRSRSHSNSYQRYKKNEDSREKEHRQKKDKKKRQRRSRSDSNERYKDKKRKRERSYSQQRQQRYDRQRKDQQKNKYKKDQEKRTEEVKTARPEIKPLQIGKIYKGKVSKVSKMGCYVHIFNVQNKLPAIVHSSHVRQQFTDDITKIVKQGLFVWVKVLEIFPDRVRLSMKEVNQYNGRQFNKKEANPLHPPVMALQPENKVNNDIGALTGIKLQYEEDVDQDGNQAYTDPWELSRMNYMNSVKKKAQRGVQEEIQETNIQVNDRQPPFLTGQTTKTGINLSPVRVIRNPEGTLNRSAMNAIQYAKQRRQIREQQNKNQVRDLNKVLDETLPTKPQPRKYFKSSNLTIRQQKEHLPIFTYRSELIQACRDNNVLIVIGETGSGKTTQITQYLYQEGFAKRGKIGCTQPRRVAAMSVAKRVCEEMSVKLGDQVGYSIRFEDHTSNKTVIKYMTDGMLLREALVDKYLRQYSVIMLDEAHERTINTDVLFGILKKVVQKRKDDFLLIVTSATLEARKFSSYFFDCKIFSIPGRTYNVEILYAKEPEPDYLDAALMCIMQIHVDEPPGDILLFLTGQEEIDTACQILNQRLKRFGRDIPQLIILPVYSALPSELQSRIFEPAPQGKRKCVIATNIAEASITIDGIFYVVDPGFAKIKIYNSKLGMDTLVVAPISQASAKQRAGRAGRTGPGKCYRIYTEQAYKHQLLPTSVPQIQRANLANIVLQLKAMGINDLINFDFMDAPPVQTLIVALEQLYYLSALDDEGLLTKLGRKMAEFPLQPPLSKMLLTSVDFGCTEEIITIIAMLSVQNIFYRPKDKETQADQKKTKFNHCEGDHLTYLQVFEAWKNQSFSATWAKENFIQQRSLRRAQDVKKQLIELLDKYRFPIRSCGKNYALIRKTIVSGFFFHAGRKDGKGGYRTLVDDHQVYIHPSSALFNKQPQWVIYHELVFTSKEYMREVCTINPKWLIDVAPNYFKFTDELGFTRKKRNQKLDPLDQRYGDPNAWRLSKRKG